jgi:hypothetical protein
VKLLCHSQYRGGALTVQRDFSWQSRGLNAAKFFLKPETVGVVLPVLDTFLREAHWRYYAIGFATALLGLGTLIFQTPAGILVDFVKGRRAHISPFAASEAHPSFVPPPSPLSSARRRSS